VLKLRDFECQFCGEQFEALHEDHQAVLCSNGHVSNRLISAPTVHTLSTHFRGTGISFGGDVYDENLCDPATRKPVPVTSLRDKQRKLKQFGLYEKGAHKGREKALKRSHSVYVKSSGTAV
jgi:hypothetical protein